MSETKWYWHIHHDVLVEQSSNIGDRKEIIRGHKPDQEIPIRLKLLTEVKDQDAIDAVMEKYQGIDGMVWGEYVKAYRERDRKIGELHKLEHPECPWDGRTIFPENKVK